MKKCNTNQFTRILCTLLLFSSSAMYALDSETIRQINDSSVSQFNLQAYQEDEAERDLLDVKSEANRAQISPKEHPICICASMDDEEEETSNDFSLFPTYYETSHPAAYHHPMNVSVDGSNVELEDQSIWQVHSWDIDKLKSWEPQHRVLIAPNKNIFTKWSYPYKLINLDKSCGNIVKAKMKFTPVLNDPNVDMFVHWIEDIDYYNRLLRLEDGSVWKVFWNDQNMMRHFTRYNIVMVGTNDGWYRGSCPNILICVKNQLYLRAVVLN